MDQDDELAEAKSKTYQMIGRNVVFFQQMEHLLKSVVPSATVSISSDTDVQSMMTKRWCEVETRTLGILVDRFINEVCDPNESDPTGESDQVYLTTTLRLKFETPEGRDAMIKRLKDLVAGRNHLVHHLLTQIDANSPESWRLIHDDLENQHRQVLLEIESLRRLVRSIEMNRALIAHPEIQRELVYGPIREQLIETLWDAAGESADPDGWTSLKAAINNDRFISPDVITELLEGYEIRTVSAFLENLRGFEIRHDRDQNGKSRTFYRVTGTQNPTAPDPAEQRT